MMRTGIVTLLVTAVALAIGGCASKAAPDGQLAAVGIRYIPGEIPEGTASLVAIQRAESDARRKLRREILANRELQGLPEDLLALSTRDEFMRAKLDELLRKAEVVEWSYDPAARRGEATVVLDVPRFQADLRAAYERREQGAL